MVIHMDGTQQDVMRHGLRLLPHVDREIRAVSSGVKAYL